mgnify:CR=1 FL=1
MSKFQRRHYEAIAQVLAYSNANKIIVLQMCAMLRRDNYRFDDERFIKAIDNYRMAGGI